VVSNLNYIAGGAIIIIIIIILIIITITITIIIIYCTIRTQSVWNEKPKW